MPTILLWFLKFIPGFSTIANLFSQWLTNQGNERLAQIGADQAVAIAELSAQVAENQAKAAVIAIPGVKWLLVLVYVPPAVHAAAIVLGLMHIGGEWNTLPLQDWELRIIESLVIMVPGLTASSAFHRWATK